MKLKKYISKESFLKLSLFLLLLGAAWIFDHCHRGNPAETQETRNSEEENPDLSESYFYTSQITITLKAPVQGISLKKLFQGKHNRLVSEQLKARSVFLLKATVFVSPHSLIALRNLLPFRLCYSDSPDDQPPLS